MKEYSLNNDGVSIETISGNDIVLPNSKCEVCGLPVQSTFAECPNCDNGKNETDYYRRNYAITVYIPVSYRRRLDLPNEIVELSDIINDCKNGEHTEFVKELLSYGMGNYSDLENPDILVYPPSKSDGPNHMIPIVERLAEDFDVSCFSPEASGEQVSQKQLDTASDRTSGSKYEFSQSVTEDETFAQAETAVVIDDVLTTGSTMSNTAGALRDEGVETVYGLTATRNSNPNHLANYAEVLNEEP